MVEIYDRKIRCLCPLLQKGVFCLALEVINPQRELFGVAAQLRCLIGGRHTGGRHGIPLLCSMQH